MVIKYIIGAICACLAVVSFNADAAYLTFDENEFTGVFGEDYPVLNFTYDIDDGDSTTADYFFEEVLRLYDNEGQFINDSIGSTIEGIEDVQVWDWFFPEPGEYDLRLHFTTFHQVDGLPECGPHSDCFYSGAHNVIVISDTMHVTLLAAPIPATVWLFGSGLLGLIGIARRKARI